MCNLIIFLFRQVTLSFLKAARSWLVLPVILISSCTVVKQYQAHKPFVFKVDIKVEGNMKPGEKSDLALRLSNQLDDSLRTQVVSLAGIHKTHYSPPVYDTANVRRSIGYMVALLNSLGYYSPGIRDTATVDTARNWKLFRSSPRDQYRVSINFRVNPGKQLKLDSIGYDLSTPALQALVMQNMGQSRLKRGDPYSKQVISDELDRLVDLFRNNGYFKFSKSDLVVVRDTVVAALIDPTLDPFQQAALLEELKRKREHPTINVVVQQRPVKDSSRLMQYYIGHVTLYPDLPLVEDSITTSIVDTSTARNFTIVSRSNKFKNAFLARNVYLRPGRLYQLNNYTRTVNRFNQLGAWQQATVIPRLSDSADSVLDMYIHLYPALKQHVDVGVEASRNTNDILAVGNLFGVGLNLGLRNRNTFRESVLSSTNLRGGVELGADFIQTTQVSFSHSIFFPKKIRITPTPISDLLSRVLRIRRDSIRTVLNVGAAYTDRRDFFTVRSANASWGYEWSKNRHTFLYRPLNVEFTNLQSQGDSLPRLLDSIPSLRLAFRSGLVISQQFVYNSIHQYGAHTDFLRISAEESGAITGLIKSWDKGDLWRFIKADIEYRHHIDFQHTNNELAMRAYAGAGWAYGREGNAWELTLPFYKAYFAGGPNSMRGWQVRQLGLGSSKFYDTAGGGKFIDRFGDIQLEGNIEYRFPLGSIFGIKLKSALFMDAGNIWNRSQTDSAFRDVGSDFKFDRFYKEIAVDAGTGIRLDFDYFLIRFDYAYRLRDPQDLYHPDKWFYALSNFGDLLKGQFQLGINYPF
ncbi:MAG: BamA/TamA family outer membrane protein [Bacteroidota bacterium]|nr:BamA/TamA family outer membrane protein [Bacteroidota bacterium]